MRFKDALDLALPLLWDGVKWYAPQVGIPVEVLHFAMSSYKKARKSKNKIRKRIGKLDDRIEDLEKNLAILKTERSALIEQWGTLDGMMADIQRRENNERSH